MRNWCCSTNIDIVRSWDRYFRCFKWNKLVDFFIFICVRPINHQYDICSCCIGRKSVSGVRMCLWEPIYTSTNRSTLMQFPYDVESVRLHNQSYFIAASFSHQGRYFYPLELQKFAYVCSDNIAHSRPALQTVKRSIWKDKKVIQKYVKNQQHILSCIKNVYGTASTQNTRRRKPMNCINC